MPLPAPDLDNRSYADLVSEARALIPIHAPEWTNHNPSDPGITLVEMFAHLTEMLVYRANRVTIESKCAFLKLLNGPTWSLPAPASIDEEIRSTMARLREPWRAVTAADFERLTLVASPDVARAKCLPCRNLEEADPAQRKNDAPAHVSVIVLPKKADSTPADTTPLIRRVAEFLDQRRLLTTRVHVVGPRYLQIKVSLKLGLESDAPEGVAREVRASLQRFFDPLVGGMEGNGWPFGRNVFLSELFRLADAMPGLDHVAEVKLEVESGYEDRLINNASGVLVGVEVEPDELVQVRIAAEAVSP